MFSATGLYVALKQDLTGQIFNGASFRIIGHSNSITFDEDLELALLSLPFVSVVYPNSVFKLESPVRNPEVIAGRSGQPAESQMLASSTDAGDQSSLAQAGIEAILELKPGETSLLTKPPPPGMNGVDKLHAADLVGSGVKIAILDSGIDAFHPSL